MFEKLFGGKKDERKSEASRKDEPRPRSAVDRAPLRPSPAREAPAPTPRLHVGEESLAAEERARAAIAAIHAAVPAPSARTVVLPEHAGVREEAAALFAVGEHKQAIDRLVGALNKSAGNSPKSIWFMLMDAYQALGQQAAFEKSAALFAGFFKTSPPSWEGAAEAPPAAATTGGAVGRNVLILDGQPAQIHPEKLKDFVAAAREEGRARLDLSRSRFDEDHSQRVDDLRILLTLMRRLRRHQVSTLLMGENQVVEVLRTVIQRDLPVPSAELYWELLLEFMQWRGQEEAYEDLAIQYGGRFGRSAPGYELGGVVALAPTEAVEEAPHGAAGVTPPRMLDEGAMERWCVSLEGQLPHGEGVLWLDFGHVAHVSFDAAVLLASRLKAWALPAEQISVEHPSELVTALFEITGVAAQATLLPRRR